MKKVNIAMLSLLALGVVSISVASEARSYRQIGNTVYDDQGNHWRRIGLISLMLLLPRTKNLY